MAQVPGCSQGAENSGRARFGIAKLATNFDQPHGLLHVVEQLEDREDALNSLQLDPRLSCDLSETISGIMEIGLTSIR